TNQTGWDMKQVSPPLKSYIDGISDKNTHILIPGCGNAYEAKYLLDRGFTNVTIVDIATPLTKQLQQQFGNNQHIKIINDDVFNLNDTYDLILEQTFFCALPLHLRTNYVSKMYNLLKPSGKLAGLLFASEFAAPGPPFGGKIADYQKLFGVHFTNVKLEPCYNSIEQRTGNELFIIAKKES
ncbi:MAG TPA: methyltransferase domain-containing protein, partial [Bacteroidia bacterium]|nr:methyltransferase domain-containing protein [Bacteroidia bacterium]